jgi:hypothetical protein
MESHSLEAAGKIEQPDLGMHDAVNDIINK